MKRIKQIIKIYYSQITGNYIIRRRKESKQVYLDLFNELKSKKYPTIDNELENYKLINKKWLDDLALVTQVTIKSSELNYQHGRILYSHLDKYLNDHKSKQVTVLETGTARGFSSVVMAKAFKDNNYKNFKIFTIDIIPHNKKIFWNSITDFEGKKTRNEILSPWNKLMKNIYFLHGKSSRVLKRKSYLKRINFAFLDGAHDYKSVKLEFDFIFNRQKRGDIIIFDDVTQDKFNGIVKLVKEIKMNNTYDVQLLNSTINRGYAIAKKT